MTGRLSNEKIVQRMQARAAPIETALGMKILAVDQDSGCAAVSFSAGREFANTQGYVGGAMLAVEHKRMVDDSERTAGQLSYSRHPFPATNRRVTGK